MTNKEVIYFLDQVRKILLDDKSWLESTIRPINEAFDMAIKALEQSELCNDDKGCSNCMYSGRPTYKSPCSECRDNSQWEMKPISRSHENGTECEDTISRQDAIDALDQIFDRCEEIEAHLPEGDPDRTGYKMYPDYMTVWKYLHQLSSAQPEQHWIPVSERMPEDGENCLVSVRCPNNFLVDRGTYSTDLFKVDKEDFFGNRGESGWYYLSSEYGYCKILNVIAWMPLPEPYRAERRTDDIV